MNPDQILIVIAISAYIAGTLALGTYFLARIPAAKAIGIPFAIVGCVVQFAELVVRNQTSHIWPLTNLYGSLSLFAAMSVAIFIGFAIRYDLWFVGGFVLALAAGFLSYGLTWNEGYLPAVPALQSYWIKIHVPLVVSSYAAFAVAFAMALVHLIKYYGERALNLRVAVGPLGAVAEGGATGATMQIRAPVPGQRSIIRTMRETPGIESGVAQGDPVALWLASLPSLPQLDIMTYRIIAVGLPLLTVGIITGAWWAKEAWGGYWQWDPKETAALFSWIVYAAYMHLHTRSAWRGVRLAWWSIFGFASILFCYLGVNIWISGLHSYKM